MVLNKFKKVPGGLKFLAVVLSIYVLTGIVDFDFAKIAFSRFFETFTGIFKILLIVFIVMFFVNIFVKPETIRRHLGKDSGAKGWFYAIIGSILISGPPYILFPFLGELRKHGVKDSLLIVFLNNRNIQPVFLPVMIFYFGTPFTVIISIYIILFSFVNGLIVGKILESKID